MTLRMMSLCSGYEGIGLAVSALLGAKLVAVSDVDKGANKILAHRFPDVPNLGDLKLIDWSAWIGTDVMTAGYPCQPFSHAGKREGTDDPRHIFPYIAEGIRVVGPRLVVLENVRGHLALGFDTVLGTLADIGYDARWVCVRASDVGAPHRRERMFIVATPHDSGRVGGNEAVELHGHGSQASHGAGVPDESDRGPGWSRPGGGAAADAADLGHERGGLARNGWAGPADDRDAAADARSERHGRREDGAGLGRLDAALGWTPDEVRREVERAAAARGGEGDRGRVDWGQYAPAIHRWAATLGRPAPAPTEPGAKGQPRLSPRFVEWMQGLPDGWVTDVPGLTRNEALKALGNGVVPQQATAALIHLLGVGADAVSA